MVSIIGKKPSYSQLIINNPKQPVEHNGIRKLNITFQKNFFTHIKNKSNGVEPGFTGQKPWTKTDEDKLLNPRNPHYKKYQLKAEKCIRKNLKDPQQNPFKEILARLGVHAEQDLNTKNIQVFLALASIDLTQADGADPQFADTIKLAFEELKKAVKRVYIVKLDYDDPLPGTDRVMIPIERAHGPDFLGPIGKLIHQNGTAAPRREKNLGAMTEALANDVYAVLKLESQDLCLRKAAYSDGYTKLLLESKFVEGPAGEKFDVLSKGIKHAVIPGNELKSPDEDLSAPIRNLGRHKIKALLLGDRDKVGRRGDNIGYIVRTSLASSQKEAVLQNIDPGKSLERKPKISQAKIPTAPKDKSVLAAIKYAFKKLFHSIQFFFAGRTDAMTHRNIHTDFSFDKHLGSILDQFQIAYDNFSIFDDTLLSEKMAGVREILNNWNQVEELFRKYKAAFSEGELNFSAEIETAWQRLNARKMYIEEVFKERLKLMPQELDFLDNVEKLTSKTVDHAGTKSDPIQLAHLRVVQKTRHEWHLTKTPNGSSYTLSFEGKSGKETDKVFHLLEQYCTSKGISLKEIDAKRSVHTKMLRHESKKIEITWTQEEFQKFRDYFSEQKIAEYKNQKLRK